MSEPVASELYGEAHRSFQDGRGTRNLADRLESLARTEFDTNDRAFIESATMFFLATVDEKGRPTVSYKGGDSSASPLLVRWYFRFTTATECSCRSAT
jgi:hypothetical protein